MTKGCESFHFCQRVYLRVCVVVWCLYVCVCMLVCVLMCVYMCNCVCVCMCVSFHFISFLLLKPLNIVYTEHKFLHHKFVWVCFCVYVYLYVCMHVSLHVPLVSPEDCLLTTPLAPATGSIRKNNTRP